MRECGTPIVARVLFSAPVFSLGTALPAHGDEVAKSDGRRLRTADPSTYLHMRLYTASLLLTTASAFQITQNIPLIHHHRTACDSTAPRMVADFSGEWEMDLDSSDSLGPLLRALGLNRLLAAVITRLAAKQSISQSSDMLTVEVTTRLSTSTLKMPFDGTPMLAPGITGGETATVSKWLDDDRLETRQALDADSSDADCFVTVRSLRDGGGTLVEAVSVVRGGQLVEGTSAERLLRRL